MTDAEIAQYYSGLLIKQYANQPNAVATIQALSNAINIGQIFNAVLNAYTLGSAVGVQLKVLGKYAGVVNYGFTSSGTVTLDDADFTTLIQLAAIRNTSDGTFASLQQSIANFFSGSVFVFDYENMRIGYLVNSLGVSSDLVQVALSQGVFPKNMGVQLGSVIYTPYVKNLFGFFSYDSAVEYESLYGTPNYNNSQFNSYDSYNLNTHYLSYDDSITG